MLRLVCVLVFFFKAQAILYFIDNNNKTEAKNSKKTNHKLLPLTTHEHYILSVAACLPRRASTKQMNPQPQATSFWFFCVWFLLLHALLPVFWYTTSPTLWVVTMVLVGCLGVLYWGMWRTGMDWLFRRQITETTRWAANSWGEHLAGFSSIAAWLLTKTAMSTQFEMLSLPRTQHVLTALLVVGVIHAGIYWYYHSRYTWQGFSYFGYLVALKGAKVHLRWWTWGACPTWLCLEELLVRLFTLHVWKPTFYSSLRNSWLPTKMKITELFQELVQLPTPQLIGQARYEQSILYWFNELSEKPGQFERAFAQWIISNDPVERQAGSDVCAAILALESTPAMITPSKKKTESTANWKLVCFSWWQVFRPMVALYLVFTSHSSGVYFASLLALLHLTVWVLQLVFVHVVEHCSSSNQFAVMRVVCELWEGCFQRARTQKVDLLDSLWVRRNQLKRAKEGIFAEHLPACLSQVVAAYALEDVQLTKYTCTSDQLLYDWLWGKPRAKAAFNVKWRM